MGRKKMQANKFRVAQNVQDWWGFTLKRGHVFGLYQPEGAKKGICYVTGGVPDERRRNAFKAYRRVDTSPNVYRWETVTILFDSKLGKMMLSVLDESQYDGVEFQPERTQPPTEWNNMPDNYKERRPMKGTRKVPDMSWNGMYFDSTPWKPGFPTYRTKRPDATPPLVMTRTGHSIPDRVESMPQPSEETASIWSDNARRMESRARERQVKYERSHALFLATRAGL